MEYEYRETLFLSYLRYLSPVNGNKPEAGLQREIGKLGFSAIVLNGSHHTRSRAVVEPVADHACIDGIMAGDGSIRLVGVRSVCAGSKLSVVVL